MLGMTGEREYRVNVFPHSSTARIAPRIPHVFFEFDCCDHLFSIQSFLLLLISCNRRVPDEDEDAFRQAFQGENLTDIHDRRIFVWIVLHSDTNGEIVLSN